MKTTITLHSMPLRQPLKQGRGQERSRQVASSANTCRRRASHTIGTSQIVDVCLAIIWAALIPGLMWLGAASGF
ncbi:MAG: hypothetical protein EPN41_14640 [Candidimonas sp.]|nr:MAG: hypothetical protein EPN41_14640 [Candidimonas sp.]